MQQVQGWARGMNPIPGWEHDVSYPLPKKMARSLKRQDRREDYQHRVLRDISGNVSGQTRWAKKSDQVVKKNRIKNVIRVYQDEEKSQLDLRRDKLLMLLRREDAQYRQEIDRGMVNSKKQHIQAKIDKMKQIRKDRAANEKVFIEEMERQQFRAGCDE